MQTSACFVRSCGYALALALCLAGPVLAGADDDLRPTQFRACEDASGAGLYWVETTTGRLWWADPATMTWVYIGQPQGAAPGPRGTYLPQANVSGEGVYILNTVTGAGWWANGKAWKVLGVPVPRTAPAEAGDATNPAEAPHE